MSGTRRGLGALGACMAVGAATLALMPAGASAQSTMQQSDPNPLSSNVPYLAWRGEHVRLVKCEGDLPGADMEALRSAATGEDELLGVGVKTDVFVEDWSGLADFQPTVAEGTVDLFLSSDGLCVKADVVSQKAGLAMIKLMVTLDPGALDGEDAGIVDAITRSEILGAHQFLAGWLTLNTPTLADLNLGGGVAGTGQYDATDDPAGEGVLRATVTGTLPLGNDFSELGLGEAITLPEGWPALAGALASDRNPDNDAPSWRWDIHDDTTAAEGHPFLANCGGGSLSPASDAVDNCEGGLAFSRFFDADGPAGPLTPIDLGLTTEDTVGPFDPQRADETLLGDGQLTADDAPMPAARIDIAIAPNGSDPAAGGTDGIGSLGKTDKAAVFSRDRAEGAAAGSGAATPHNLYAPFYSAYIPATADGSFFEGGDPVSGTDGPSMGNNFPGFLVGDGLGGEGDLADVDNTYDFWDIAHVFRSALGTATTCLHRDDLGDAALRATPLGAQRVAVYTDEHGMAHVNFRPGTGAFYDALPGVVRNANGGCDLEGVNPLGTAAITATARYPYQPTTDIAPRVSDTVNLTVNSLFTKFLTEFPKGEGDANANARIIVAHAQDVDGTPEADEVVCFNDTSGYGTIRAYVPDGFNQAVFGGYDLSGSSEVSVPAGATVVCMRTNAAGNAAVELFESQGRVVNIVGEFTNERLLRSLDADFTTTPTPIPVPPTGPTTPGAGQTPQTATGNGSGNGNSNNNNNDNSTKLPTPDTNGAGTPSPAQATATVKAVDQALGQATPKVEKASVKVRFARLTVSAKGARTLTLRLDGAKGARATVRVKLLSKRGKVLSQATRTVSVGRTVKISNMKISKKVVRASVTVVG